MSPDTSPSSDAGVVEPATPSYGASGASLASFRRKYGPVQHTPSRMTHSVSVGPSMFSPESRGGFDLWKAGGSNFPSPNKAPRMRGVSPAKMFLLF
jgi:hypothetical protein